MDLVSLSDDDFDEIETLFTQFHHGYAPFFQNAKKSVAKSAKDYLHGQLFTIQQMNMKKYCREVPDSEYEAMQHFISSSQTTRQVGPSLNKNAMGLWTKTTDRSACLCSKSV